MSTGQTSSSFAASSRSAATASSTSTSMNTPASSCVSAIRPVAPSFSLTRSGISSIRSTTGIPAASSLAIFSVAVSSAPSTIVPAWPKLIPFISSESMKRPAMKATIGSRDSFSVTHSDSCASIRPPGSV